MIPPSPLEDPVTAAHAWGRYRRIMGFMAGVTLCVVLLAMASLYVMHGAVSIHAYIATALGISLTMLTGSALMGLVFLSSGTGHDESVVDPLEDEHPYR